MADTGQIVNWSLERKCPFRQGKDWQKPRTTFKATAPLRSYSNCPPNSIHGDVCVTGWSYSKAGTKPIGYRISEVFTPFGGFSAAQEICGKCEANVWNDRFEKMGGCAGVVGVDPDSTELESALSEAIGANSLQEAMRVTFISTKPTWYGLWMNSPLNMEQCRLLLRLLANLYLLDLSDRRFLLALEASIAHGMPLHVFLTPLGHTDFGFYKVFPHCPRCKAFAGLRWQKEYPRDPMTCRVCGDTFIPAETSSSEQMETSSWNMMSTPLTDSESQEICKKQTPPPHPMSRFLSATRQAENAKNLKEHKD